MKSVISSFIIITLAAVLISCTKTIILNPYNASESNMDMNISGALFQIEENIPVTKINIDKQFQLTIGSFYFTNYRETYLVINFSRSGTGYAINAPSLFKLSFDAKPDKTYLPMQAMAKNETGRTYFQIGYLLESAERDLLSKSDFTLNLRVENIQTKKELFVPVRFKSNKDI